MTYDQTRIILKLALSQLKMGQKTAGRITDNLPAGASTNLVDYVAWSNFHLETAIRYLQAALELEECQDTNTNVDPAA